MHLRYIFSTNLAHHLKIAYYFENCKTLKMILLSVIQHFDASKMLQLAKKEFPGKFSLEESRAPRVHTVLKSP